MTQTDDKSLAEEKELEGMGKAATGTNATDHLANERTFLAWIRTSLAVIALGFAVAKFGTWLREMVGQTAQAAEAARSSRSLIVGLVMIGVGGMFALIAAWRYRVVAKQIEAGAVRPDGVIVAVVTVIILVLAAVVGGLTLHGVF
jgi:putative membrane protein